MIELQGVSKGFGPVEAVRQLSFRVPEGSICGFLGPNGAGKSTVIRMIAGALAPDSGRIRVAGLDLERDRYRVLANLGWLPEQAPLPPELRVEEMIDVRARLLGLERRERRAAVEAAIDACSLATVRRRLCGQLSKGFRQRAGLAAALVHQPRVMVLDEPTSGLDPGQIDEFRELMRRLAGVSTILLSTHVLSEVEAICGHVIVIDRGSLLAEGAVDDLRSTGESSRGPGARAGDAQGGAPRRSEGTGGGERIDLESLYRGLLGGRRQ